MRTDTSGHFRGLNSWALTVTLSSDHLGVVELAYRAIVLNAAPEGELSGLIDRYSADCDVIVTLQGAPKGDMIVSAGAAERVERGTGTGS